MKNDENVENGKEKRAVKKRIQGENAPSLCYNIQLRKEKEFCYEKKNKIKKRKKELVTT